jgi:2-dehydropantoate 2-reductase
MCPRPQWTPSTRTASRSRRGTPATRDPGAVGPVDLIVAFTKCHHTEAAVRSALPMMGEATAVLSLQNGWGNAPRIAAIAGEARVMIGVTYHSATLLAPGRVKHPGAGATYVGELDGMISDRLARVAAPRNDAMVWLVRALEESYAPTGVGAAGVQAAA